MVGIGWVGACVFGEGGGGGVREHKTQQEITRHNKRQYTARQDERREVKPRQEKGKQRQDNILKGNTMNEKEMWGMWSSEGN